MVGATAGPSKIANFGALKSAVFLIYLVMCNRGKQLFRAFADVMQDSITSSQLGVSAVKY